MANTGRLIIRATAAVGAAGFALAAAATPASAHYNYIYHGSDFASINSSHSTISVCDRENDGHVVFARVRTTSGTTHVYQDSTANGVCASYPLVINPSTWVLCEATAGCTPNPPKAV